MNTNQGALYFGAGIDMNEWRRNITEMRRDILGLTQQTQRETQQMDNSFKNLSIGIGAYFSASMLKGFVNEIINVRGEFQKTEIAFATMLKSKEEAKVLMGQMVDLAAKTPFGLQDVTEGAKRLLAFQVPANEVVDTLRRMGDVAAGLGVPMGQLIHVYGQVKAQGKLMTNDLYQFMNAGIPILSELGKVLGKTEAEIKNMVGEGKIGFTEIQQVIQNMTNEGGLFFNLMEQQSASLSGKVANLQDAFEQMLNKIGESSEGILAGGIDGITYLVENYETLGSVILSLISAYGAYRAVLITTSAWNNIVAKNLVFDIATKKVNIALTWAQVKAQLALNTSMLANPVALVIAGVVALGVALYTLSDSTDEATKAEKRLAEAREESRKKTEEDRGNIQKYIQDIKSATSTIYDKIEALKELQKIAPDVFKNMVVSDVEQIGVDELNEKVTAFLSKKRENETKKQLEEVEKKIEDITNKIQNSRTDNFQHAEIEAVKKLYQDRDLLVKKLQEEKEEHFKLVTPLKEQLAYWERIIEEKERELGISENIFYQQSNTKKGLYETVSVLGNLASGAGFFAFQLANARKEADRVRAALSVKEAPKGKEEKDFTKVDWEKQGQEAQQKLNSMTVSQLSTLEAKKLRETIERSKKEIEKYDVKNNSGTASKRPAVGGTKKELAEVFGKDSIADLDQRISLLNNALSRAFVDEKGNYIVEERIKDQYGKERKSGKTLSLDTALQQLKELEAKRDKVKKTLSTQSFEDELSETERQWRIRYKIAEKYGEEVAKAQFPDLKGESYYDEVLKKFKPLDSKAKEGVKLTDEELEQWQKLKEILDNLNGEKDPFTNWKESLDNTLSTLENSTERLEYLQKLKEDLTAEQRDSGAEAEINNRIASEESALKTMYNNFLQEHKTYEEKVLSITKKYAELKSQAKSQSEADRIKQEESKELSKLDFDFFKESGDWELAFTNLDYLSRSTIQRIIGKFEEFKKAKAETLQPTELKELTEVIEKLRKKVNINPFTGIINGIKEVVSAKESVKKAQEEYDNAVEEGGEDSDIAREKYKKLTEEERKLVEQKQKLADASGEANEIFQATISGITDITDAFGGFDDATNDALEDIANIGGAALELGESIASGNVAGMIKAGIKLIGSLFKAFSGDKRRERSIKTYTQAVKELQRAFEDLERATEKALGTDKYSNQKEQIKNLEQQQEKIRAMMSEEEKKKKSDKGKIEEYQRQIDEARNRINDIYDDIANDLMQTSVKDAASKVGDALVDAFSRGESAVKSLENAANDMIKSILKNQINKALEKKIAPLIEQFIQQSGILEDGNGFSITKEMLDNFKAGIMGLEGVAQNLFDMLGDFMGDDLGTNSVKGAIQGMTEKTAGVLEGQFNAIRMNTAEILYIMKQAYNQGFGIDIATNSLSTLIQIEYNTSTLHSIRQNIAEINSRLAGNNIQQRANGL